MRSKRTVFTRNARCWCRTHIDSTHIEYKSIDNTYGMMYPIVTYTSTPEQIQNNRRQTETLDPLYSVR